MQRLHHDVASASLVLTNGKIYTVNPAQPWADAIVVSGKKIAYVGDNAGAEAFIGEGTRKIDLDGRFVLPGFIESHIHMVIGAATTSGVQIGTEDDIDTILGKLRSYANQNSHKKVIFGASYLSSRFDEKGPSKELLDAIVPDRPVFLLDHTLHSAWVNSKTYERAGVDKNTPNPPGGEYVKNAQGELSGWIKGSPAHIPVLKKIEAITAADLENTLPRLLKALSRFGFTSAIDMGAVLAADESFEALVSLDRRGELPMRVSLTHFVNTPLLAQSAVEKLKERARKYRSEHVWFDTLKIVGDSVVENKKAALLEPYENDPNNYGSLYFDHDALMAMILPTARAGFNVTIHAIGDRAVRTALDAAQALRNAGFSKTRFCVTHSQLVHPSDRRKYKELNVTAQTTGNWAVPQSSYPGLIGQVRNDTFQLPFHTWARAGVNIALGSDWPATPGGIEHGINPFNNIYSAMHRRGPAHILDELGTNGEILPPDEEVLTLEEAIEGYTMGGARMLGIDNQVGSLEVGKKADMIVLDQNLFEIEPISIPHTKVRATLFDGKFVYDSVYGLGNNEFVDLVQIGKGAADPCARDHQH